MPKTDKEMRFTDNNGDEYVFTNPDVDQWEINLSTTVNGLTQFDVVMSGVAQAVRCESRAKQIEETRRIEDAKG